MTEEIRNDEVETSTDEVVNEIVEETLEEAEAMSSVKTKGSAKDASPVSEPESIASVDKAADAVKPKQAPAPKTKAGMISAMTDIMLKKSKADMEAMYNNYHNMKKEEVEEMEGEAIVESPEVDTMGELNALVESEATLSDEFKEKTAVIFEAAVKSKLSEEIDRLESQYKEELEEEISSTKSEMVEKVDSYLNYVVENWMKENELQVENGLRTEIAEGFMSKLKDLFSESYIEVPESKVDLVDELAEQVEELESKLNETTQKVIDQSGELEEMKKEEIIRESSSDLADTQVEKLKTLVNDLDFEDAEKFAEKVKTVKEAHFSNEPSGSDEIISEETEGESDELIESSSSMDKYVSTLRKTQPKS
tara:strand:+ start:752 stop:1846 length:1095 start_codon:yes stop_codon:yes gene_type:complete